MQKGIDAPLVPTAFILVGLISSVVIWQSDGQMINWWFPFFLFISAAFYLHTTLWGKYRIIDQVVMELHLPATSQVLDLGTGHGAVLLAVAQRLQAPGQVVGVDLWRSRDQSHNSLATTQANLDQAGVTAVAQLKTANMTDLPFPDAHFDYVFASFAIHNVKPKAQREQALAEAWRVLKDQGQLVIIDLEHIREYYHYLTAVGATVTVTGAGVNGLWGLAPTKILIARK